MPTIADAYQVRIAELQRDLASAHGLLHLLVTNYCDGRLHVTADELYSLPRRSWLSSVPDENGGMIVRAR
jgi:hypothetical protein